MSSEVSRPKAGKSKIHSKNEFELCYLRHQYIRKTTTNPTKDEMAPYFPIAKRMACDTFFTYISLFQIIGFELDDLISIAQIHLISFLGLFSLESTPEKYKEFLAAHEIKYMKKAKEWDVQQKNKAIFTLFMKQRMEDVVRVCRQKAKNIKGVPVEEYFYYYGPKKPPAIFRDLINNHERYGFKKLENAVYRSIKKKAVKEDSPVFKFDGNYYIAVPVEKKNLNVADFCGAGFDPNDNMHSMNPEQNLFLSEEAITWEEKQEEFNSKPNYRKANIVKKFIRNNKNNPELKEEIRLARKFLKELGGIT